MMDWMLLIISNEPIRKAVDGSYDLYFYCAIQATALLITYFVRKKGIVTSGSPLRHYILGLMIGHVVYVVKGLPLFIVLTIIGVLHGDFAFFAICCAYLALLAIPLLITYFLRKKEIVTSASPLMSYLLALIIAHVTYSVIVYWLFINFVTFFIT